MLEPEAAQTPPALADAISRACDRRSRYWLHLHRPSDAESDHEIEIGIDVPPDAVDAVTNVPGWRIVEVRPDGRLFLRRFQPLTKSAVRALIAEAVTLAHRYGGKFHAWTHEREMLDWLDSRR